MACAPLVRAAETPAHENGDALILEIENKAELLRFGLQAWNRAQTNQVLHPRDRFRTSFKSRATLRLSNQGILRVSPLTTLEIQPPSGPERPHAVLDLRNGAAYFFNRDEPVETQFRTPQASGAIRGTEFNIEVAEDGTTIVTLIDGAVDLSNDLGQISLTSGQQGTVEPGAAPRLTAVINAVNIIQWNLYYPAILDIARLDLPAEINASTEAYALGDLPGALEAYPEDRNPASPAESLYLAMLDLSVGQVNSALERIEALATEDAQLRSAAAAIGQLVAAVKFETFPRDAAPVTATEWMAESYYHQSRANLEAARAAARRAVEAAPDFGYAWARLAEMEFSFGDTAATERALQRAVELAPRNAQAIALQGFILAAQRDFAAAAQQFDRAIELDGALGNAWLGRGLTRIRLGRADEGRQDLQVAATHEPNRSLLRSYLGKAYSVEGDLTRAHKELDLARQFDPNDPTPWLYSALLRQQENRVNDAVRELEQSQELNDNRAVFRSRLLLDQDRAVRSANLAAIYRDAGLREISVREANRAVESDYGNYSAHLFLANSYNELRDPRQINLRYETPWFSELLLANLLAPVGAGTLSQNISQQEYSALIDHRRFGIISSSEYLSRGDWIQSGSIYGTFGNTSYSFDAHYRSENGDRPNNDFEALTLWAKFKQQLTARDSIFVQANYYDAEFGDVAQVYDPDREGSRTLRVQERQDPNLFVGYHREWDPGIHTLFLAGLLRDTLEQRDPEAPALTLTRNAAGLPIGLALREFGLDYESDLRAYSAELQQIFQQPGHTFVAGLRFQTGEVETDATLSRSPTAFPPIYSNPPASQSIESDLDRFSAYSYYIWEPLDWVQLTAGVSYDHLTYPLNSEIAPLSEGDRETDQVSPKIGLRVSPWKDGYLRGVYTRSLGGVFYDQSVRLEPTQIAGFNQAFRSLIPESVAGLIPGSEFETFGAGFDQSFPTGTYIDAVGEILRSDSDRLLGAFTVQTPPAVPGGIRQLFDFEERTLALAVNQLISEDWALGATYRISQAELDQRLRGIPEAVTPAANQHNEALMQQLSLDAFYNLPCGFFSQAQGLWTSQDNDGYTPELAGEDFWQLNLYLGYRFLRRHAEVRVGLLNITDQDYRLNPLNLHASLPRDRTLAVRLKFNF